jgi:hypothetical protein
VDQFDQEWQLLVFARAWLGERGYLLIDSRGPEGMEQGFNVYLGDRLGIRMVVDRGSWDVEVHPGPQGVDVFHWQRWFNMEAWSVCLGEPVLFHDPRPTLTDDDWYVVLANSWRLQPQLDYLRDHLSAIEGACAPERTAATLVCLSKALGGGACVDS